MMMMIYAPVGFSVYNCDVGLYVLNCSKSGIVQYASWFVCCIWNIIYPVPCL